ncbi:MAG: hypothetical protein M3Y87_25335 [Myxococcota bacterium]|nr:hypothetical protein [Myxococcota bacterium]
MTQRAAFAILILLLSAGCDDGPAAALDGMVELDDGGAAPRDGSGETCDEIAASITCSDADRQCGHRALGAHCATERSDVLAADLECIRAHSEDSCRSFPDPSGAEECIRAAHDLAGYAPALPLADRLAARCADAFPDSRDAAIHRMVPPLATLSATSLDALMPCVEAATSCDAAMLCFEARYPAVYACYE